MLGAKWLHSFSRARPHYSQQPLCLPCEVTSFFVYSLTPFSLSFYLYCYEKNHSNLYRTLTGLNEFDITTLKPVWIGWWNISFRVLPSKQARIYEHHPRCDTYTLQVSNSHKTIITRFPQNPINIHKSSGVLAYFRQREGMEKFHAI